MSNKIVFFGSGPVAEASLEFLLGHFEVEAVITKPATVDDMRVLAKGAPTHSVGNKAELDELVEENVFESSLAVLIDFGIIVSQKVINRFDLGIVNSHFSLLPQLRGADPISHAILNGLDKTGVTLMLVSEGLDEGKILVQKSLKIESSETTPSLTDKLVGLSNHLLVENLPLYASGKLKPRQQPHPDRATYSKKLSKLDGQIIWGKPAMSLEREVRAYLDWPKSRTNLGKVEVVITKAHAMPGNGKPGTIRIEDSFGLYIYCGEGYLCIDRLKPVGKKEMSVQEFLVGYKDRLF